MPSGNYISKVKKTFPTLTVDNKLSLRDVVRDAQKVRVSRYTSLLYTCMGKLLSVEGNYILGLPPTAEEKEAAISALEDVCYPFLALVGTFKLSLPSMNKRVRLEGTRGSALLRLHNISLQLYSLVDTILYSRPVMTEELKNVRNPHDGSFREALVTVVDHEANCVAWESLYVTMTPLISEFTHLFYGYCYLLTGKVPAYVFNRRLEKLIKEFPLINFSPKKIVSASINSESNGTTLVTSEEVQGIGS